MSEVHAPSNEKQRGLRVFLCHSSTDKSKVRSLYYRLKQDGFTPWLDENDLIPGQEWQEEIPKAVRASDVVAVCLSQGYVTKEGYVNKEIKFALDIADEKPEGTIFIIPVRLDEVAVPSRLKRWHWVNLFENDGYPNLLRALITRRDSLNIRSSSTLAPLAEPMNPADSPDISAGRVEKRLSDGADADAVDDPLSFAWMRFKRWLIAKIGVRWATGILVALVLGFLILRNWKDISEMPGVRQLLETMGQKHIHRGAPDRLTIAVAHLDNDRDGRNERLLLDELEKFEGADVLPLDTSIAVSYGGTLEENLAKAHAQARRVLEEYNAQALLWGSVVEVNGRTTFRLRWTASNIASSGQRYDPDADLNLPSLFWEDLTHILGLVVQTRMARFAGESGTFQSDRLQPFIADVRRLLNDPNSRWGTMDRTSVEFALGYSLLTVSIQSNDNAAGLEAIQLFRSVLSKWTEENSPLQWARAQDNLGTALGRLGDNEAGIEHLQEAVTAYRAALKEWTRDRVPLDWARAQNNLGAALESIGERESGTEHLNEAIQCYRNALQEWTRDKVPLNWALVQNNLGNAFQVLGAKGNGTQQLQEATVALRAALEEWSPTKAPIHWAGAQVNLGNTLQVLAQRRLGTEDLNDAVQAYRAALQVYTKEKLPAYWATTQNALGSALYALGDHETGIEHFQDAERAFNAALTVWTRETEEENWAGVENNLGALFVSLGERETGTENLQEAVRKYRELRGVWKAKTNNGEWMAAQVGLCNALRALGTRETSTKDLEESVRVCRIALNGSSRAKDPMDWALAQNNLGDALLALGEQKAGNRLLNEATTAFSEALKERTKESSPIDWAATQGSLGRALQVLGERTASVKLLGDATTAYKNALEVFSQARFVWDEDQIEKKLEETRKKVAVLDSKK